METNEAGKPSAARRGSPVWVRDEQLEGLRRMAEADGESVAFHARRAIAAYLRVSTRRAAYLKKHDKPTMEVRA